MQVIIATEDSFLTASLSNAIKSAGHEVAGPVNSSIDIFEQCKSKRPPVAIVDISFENKGLSIAEQLCETYDIYTLVFDTNSDSQKHNGFDCLDKNYCQSAVEKIQAFYLNSHW